MNKKTAYIAILLSSLLSSGSFASTLYCPDHFTNGTYTGHFTDVMDRNGWKETTYILQLDNGRKGCVMVDNNTVRRSIIYNAFLLGSQVIVTTNGDHTITGIGYRNDE